MSDQPDIKPEDALQVAQRALAKVNELEAIEEEVDELREELTAVKLRVSEFDEENDYEAMTRDEKIGKVREHAFNKAVESHGKAALDYDDIMWGPFDGDPSADFCYKLMRLAADSPGFEVRDPAGESRKLTVNAEAAKQGPVFSSANKTPQEDTQL